MIKMLLLDVDGVMTDGTLLYSPQDGEELKAFNVKDGSAIKRLLTAGINVGIISGKESKAVTVRCKELGIDEVHQGIEDKKRVFEQIMKRQNLEDAMFAYIGDDIPDIDLLSSVGFSCAPQDAHPAVKEVVDYISPLAGGKGCVYDCIEKILREQL